MASTIEKGLLAEKELDRVAVRVWRTAFRLGMFEFKKKKEAKGTTVGKAKADSDPWAQIGFSAIDSAAHREEVSFWCLYPAPPSRGYPLFVCWRYF